MPSTRKRIGYLPSHSTQEIIIKIANLEKLSQSKVVGILVEEALLARGLFEFKKRNDLIRNSKYFKNNNQNSSSFKYDDLDEMISDNGITYNFKNDRFRPNSDSLETRQAFNEELFEQFKQFMLYKKSYKKNNKL